MSRLHVFDMDGTLLRGTTASLEIARRLGCLPDLIRLETEFATGTVDTRAFAARICLLWRELTYDVVADVFARAPWIGGLAEVFEDIRRRGERSIVVTMSPDFFADGLRAFGADDVVASRFPALPLRTGPDPEAILTPADKVTIVHRARAALGLHQDRCVAYGDSASDLPLFRELTHTVAVNADRTLGGLARHRYDGDDLRVAYRIARVRPPSAPDGPSRVRPKERQ
ncbi:HAD-IB family phosphatase [Streptomyces sp. NPDC006622]|uniref:HAD family hydrolase n=1 Tax=Streptomyces sp. NPDC006622 TaxID=3155459 RepID=UPI0033A3E205